MLELIYYSVQAKKVGHLQAWRELQQLGSLKFRYKSKESPRAYVKSLAANMHSYPMEEVLSGDYLLTDWQPEEVSV